MLSRYYNVFIVFGILFTVPSATVFALGGGVDTTVLGSAPDGRKDTVHAVLSDPLKRAMHDSTKIQDSLVVRFIPGAGKLTQQTDTNNVLHRSQLLWTDTKTFSELIWKIPGFFWRDLGEAGKYGQLNAYGVDNRGVSILLDGRPMSDPITGGYNFNDMPLEFLEDAEVSIGESNGISPTDMAVNFVSRTYNSYRPYTKIRFVQSPNENLLTDFLFTQNIARGMNLTAAFDRTVTNGNYRNAALDSWNVRTRLRYDVSDRLNISLSDFYTKATNGLNGGDTPVQSIDLFSGLGSEVYNPYAYDIRSRHDLTLNGIARITADTLSTTQWNIFYTAADREYRDPYTILDVTSASLWGMNLRQNVDLPLIRGNVGFQWEQISVDSCNALPHIVEPHAAYYAQAELDLVPFIIPELSYRKESLRGLQAENLSAGVSFRPLDWLGIDLHGSWYDRVPTIEEYYWTDSLLLRNAPLQNEHHELLRAGLTVQFSDSAVVTAEAYQRTITNAVLFQPSQTIYGTPALSIDNVHEVQVQGVNGSFRWRWKGFEVYGVMTLSRSTIADTAVSLMPGVILSGELSYHNVFFKNTYDAKIGVRSLYYNRQAGETFNPELLAYSTSGSTLQFQTQRVDVFAILKIGDAHLSVTLANVLGADYFLAPYYPMPGRQFILGLHWTFLD